MEWLIVALLFAVTAIGLFMLTGSLMSSLIIGLLVGVVAVAVVAML